MGLLFSEKLLLSNQDQSAIKTLRSIEILTTLMDDPTSVLDEFPELTHSYEKIFIVILTAVHKHGSLEDYLAARDNLQYFYHDHEMITAWYSYAKTHYGSTMMFYQQHIVNWIMMLNSIQSFCTAASKGQITNSRGKPRIFNENALQAFKNFKQIAQRTLPQNEILINWVRSDYTCLKWWAEGTYYELREVMNIAQTQLYELELANGVTVSNNMLYGKERYLLARCAAFWSEQLNALSKHGNSTALREMSFVGVDFLHALYDRRSELSPLSFLEGYIMLREYNVEWCLYLM